MNYLVNNTALASRTPSGADPFLYNTNSTNRFNPSSGGKEPLEAFRAGSREKRFINPAADYLMASGQIPDLHEFCTSMVRAYDRMEVIYSAKQFAEEMQQVPALDQEQVNRFIRNPENRQVLASNHQFELVLIHWKPGKASDIHGHPGGGCLFRLLQGKLEELRYTPGYSRKLLSTNSYRSGDMTYIDNHMAYHQVGNPYGSSAISLHLYFQ